MVFLTQMFLRGFRANPTPGPERFWKTRRVFRLTGHLYGRRRNCYRTAIRALHHCLEDVTIGRRIKKRDIKILWDTRIHSAALEHDLPGDNMRDALQRCNIFLNRKVLADLAIWEPRTFKALTDVAKTRAAGDTDILYPSKENQDISHFVTKGLLHQK